MKKYFSLIMFLIFVASLIVVSGCGETFTGMARDLKRMGKGVKTVFVREEQ